MGQISAKYFLLLIARLVLVWIFIRAGLPKVQDPIAFAASIDGYRIISSSLSIWVALFLPWLEIVIAVGLLTPWLQRASATIMALLLGLFIILHGSAWARGLDINCGCFGESSDSPDYHWLILRNLAILAVTIFVILTPARNKNTAQIST